MSAAVASFLCTVQVVTVCRAELSKVHNRRGKGFDSLRKVRKKLDPSRNRVSPNLQQQQQKKIRPKWFLAKLATGEIRNTRQRDTGRRKVCLVLIGFLPRVLGVPESTIREALCKPKYYLFFLFAEASTKGIIISTISLGPHASL